MDHHLKLSLCTQLSGKKQKTITCGETGQRPTRFCSCRDTLIIPRSPPRFPFFLKPSDGCKDKTAEISLWSEQGVASATHRTQNSHNNYYKKRIPVWVGIHNFGAHFVNFGSVHLLSIVQLYTLLLLFTFDQFVFQLSHPQLQLLHCRHFKKTSVVV